MPGLTIKELTVGEIRLLLAGEEPAPAMIARFRNDERASVQKLLRRWEQLCVRDQAERERILKLYHYERELNAQGHRMIAGVDEAGRGPLAGPVVVAAVILPLEHHIPGLNDSKKMTKRQRELAYDVIHQQALALAYVALTPAEIDAINIYQATVQGMYRAVAALAIPPQAVLIDAVPLPQLSVPWQALIGGDALSASIAAASVIAKVERDRMMADYDRQYPGYGFFSA